MHDIIIVGGGFAGVTAARELRAAGLSSLIIEGRDRIGGRTWRDTHNGHPFEVGGAYVHWSQPHIWSEITRYGLKVGWGSEDDIDEIRVLSQGKLHTLDAEKGYVLLEEAYAALYNAKPQTDDLFPFPYDPLTHREWMPYANVPLSKRFKRLDLPPLQRDLLYAMLTSDLSSPLDESGQTELLRLQALLGTDDFAKLSDVNGTYVIKKGTSVLIERMLEDSGAGVCIGQVVTQIDQTSEGVVVRTDQGHQYTARAVVVAIPLNTWANITFTPALNEAKQRVAQQRHAGLGVKVFVRVKGKFPGLLALAPEEHLFSLLMASHVEKGNPWSKGSTWLIGFGSTAPEVFTLEWARDALAPLLPGVEVWT
ncbi:MAG: Monoamine oxidase [Chloroflexi bacterium AL-W]|nr:Monoamine oxidase [Chloroflexi bacterium AL-N1]NOK64737.1 Monoamine oxidase [Chloroflexi bacterium AL-N10]NOK75978.1 Monoamine oxidase [Chloroflexi bacterium AL-N5]NOK80263.1 Monoamine oxidase [Chloroflexi bacterium AL-W]NOK86776.1 Monoamine oxidase [Chloroflexi bacterium AL-N15]